MSKNVFGTVLTHHGVASNNRGEVEGNVSRLQKVIWSGLPHTIVSAASIRRAIRNGLPQEICNRTENPLTGKIGWKDSSFSKPYVDDEFMGYMDPQAAGDDNENEAENKKSKKHAKGTARIQRALFEVTPAISLRPFLYEASWSVRGATEDSHPAPFQSEIHSTSYQYSFHLTPESVSNKSRPYIDNLLESVCSANHVAGNQTRYMFDFSAASIILRITDDVAQRCAICFKADDNGNVSIPRLIQLIEQGDIDPQEIIIGGDIVNTPDGQKLKELGVFIPEPCGIKAAKNEAMKRINALWS